MLVRGLWEIQKQRLRRDFRGGMMRMYDVIDNISLRFESVVSCRFPLWTSSFKGKFVFHRTKSMIQVTESHH